jgi:hypothetical protein
MTEIEITYCDKCSDELEPSQVGLCDECRPRSFDELDESAKDKARDKIRYDGVQDDWWDTVYEDAVRMGALLGVNISSTQQKTSKGRTYTTTDISFSGFCSQGDGASFVGNYRFAPDALLKIQEETTDEELIRIAQELLLLQLGRRMKSLEPFSATISTSSSNYSHSGTMRVDVNSEDENDEHDEVSDSLEDDVTQLMRDFADWIYKNLETEHDYLTSDECIDQYLAEEKFDADGDMI